MIDDAYRWAWEIIDACWVLFVAVWAIAAFSTKRTVYRQRLGQRVPWIVIVVIGAVALYQSARGLSPLNDFLWPRSVVIAAAAALFCVCGLVFAFWARATIGRNWSGLVTLKEDHELIERGPYRLVRHPIYSGILLMIAGSVLAVGRIGALGAWLLIFAAFWIKLREEERLMLRQFPDQYAAYSRRVKRIIPFVL